MTAGQTVTTGAGAGAVDLRMIDGNHRRPRRRTMTGLTDVGAVDMAGRQTVATGTGASAIELRMIKGDRWRPR